MKPSFKVTLEAYQVSVDAQCAAVQLGILYTVYHVCIHFKYFPQKRQ